MNQYKTTIIILIFLILFTLLQYLISPKILSLSFVFIPFLIIGIGLFINKSKK